MGITPITSDIITKEALAVLHNSCRVVKAMDRSWNSLFGKAHGPVSKPGDTINIRRPTRGTKRTGWAMDVSDIVESSVPLKIDTIIGVDLEFRDDDLLLNMGSFLEYYVRPNAMLLASLVDAHCGKFVKDHTPNCIATTTLGNAPNSLSFFLDAKRKVYDQLAPMDSNLSSVISPRTEAAMVNNVQGIYNPAGVNSSIVKSGRMSTLANLDWYTSQNLPMHVHGTMTVTTATISGYTTTALTLSNAGNGVTLEPGDVLQITGCYDVNPETKEAYGTAKQVVVTETSTALTTGVMTVKVLPEIVLTGPNQSIASTPVGKTIVPIQTTSGQSVYNDLVLHPKSFAIAFANLSIPRGMDMASRKSYDGVSLRFVRGFNIQGGCYLSRLEVLFGVAAVRPELSCKIIS